MSPDEFFAEKPRSASLFAHITRLLDIIGPTTLCVSKSQIAFRRRRAFAWVWMPEQYLRRPAAPLVLSIALPYRDGSLRWKEVVEPRSGHFMHHLEVFTHNDLDAEVRSWLQQGWEAAG
jgi:hypothetical protein